MFCIMKDAFPIIPSIAPAGDGMEGFEEFESFEVERIGPVGRRPPVWVLLGLGGCSNCLI